MENPEEQAENPTFGYYNTPIPLDFEKMTISTLFHTVSLLRHYWL